MSKAKEKFLILDGNALLHRAWHAIPPLTTRQGLVVNAAYGFTMLLEKMLEKFKPAYMAVAWDLPEPTFRHKKFAAYKAQREKKAQELYDQIPLVQNILQVHGIPSLSAPGFEADDIIATLSDFAGKKGVEAYIVTGDLDSLQLVDADTFVVFLQKGISETKLYDVAAVKERYGLTPAQLIDYKALRGDPSDNLPGIAGIGEKAATELVGQFNSIDGIIKAMRQGQVPAKYQKKLSGQEKTMAESRALVELVHTVPLTFRLAAAKLAPPNQDALIQIYRDLEFRTLLQKHAKNFVPPPPPVASAPAPTKKFVVIRQLSELVKVLPSLSDEAIGLFAVEQPEDLFGAKVSALAVSDGVTTFICPNPGAAVFDALQKKIDSVKELVVHDLKRLLPLSSWPSSLPYFDLMIASYLLSSGSRAHDLNTIAHAYLKTKLPSLPERAATDQEYAALAAVVAVFPALARALKQDLAAKNLSKIFSDLEMPLIPVLSAMQQVGIRLDAKLLKKLSKDFGKQIDALAAAVLRAAGVEFNVNSPSQLADVLFNRLKLPTKGIKKTQSGYSTAAPELDKLMDAHPIVPLISEYRELAKLQNTYVEALPKLLGPDQRLHTTFNQTVTATGRLSSSDPNLQNIPIKTELGNKIRAAFVAAPGKQLLAADYSQIELRLVAHLAKDKTFLAAFNEGADIHTRTAAEIAGIAEAAVTKEQRRAAKAINFGVIYGMGPRALARSTGLTLQEAQDFIDRYFELHQSVREYLDGTKAFAHAEGYVETMFGRRRYLPELQSGMPMLVAAAERMAINMPVQGTAADLMKKAMLEVASWLRQSRLPAVLLLQVHDELVLEVDARFVDQVARGLKEIMENVAKLDVPLVVDVEVGDNWGEMEEWKK